MGKGTVQDNVPKRAGSGLWIGPKEKNERKFLFQLLEVWVSGKEARAVGTLPIHQDTNATYRTVCMVVRARD